MKWLKKVASTPLTTIARVIDSLQSGQNETTNAPSIKAVNDALTLKQNTLNFDTTPTFNSANPVTSDGLKNFMDSFFDQIHPRKSIVWVRGDDQDPNETMYRGTWTYVGRYTYHEDDTTRIFYAWQRTDYV